MAAHRENASNHFAVLDPRQGSEPSNGIVTQRNNLTFGRRQWQRPDAETCTEHYDNLYLRCFEPISVEVIF
jgi:hypothetical protein